MRILKIVLVVIIVLGVTGYILWPFWYMNEWGYHKIGYWERALFNFCKYEIPEIYKVASYSQGHPDSRNDKYLIVFKDNNDTQRIVLSRIRGFHYVSIANVQIDSQNFGRSFVHHNTWTMLPNFNVELNIPALNFLRVEDQSKIPNELVLKGMDVTEQKQYPMKDHQILYLKGTFQKLGFFKELHFPWQYAAPIYDFTHASEGAVAILTNDQLKETIFVIGHPKLGHAFDEVTFKTFVDSITFEKDIYEPPPVPNAQTRTKISFN